jgi:hypothetical protein
MAVSGWSLQIAVPGLYCDWLCCGTGGVRGCQVILNINPLSLLRLSGCLHYPDDGDGVAVRNVGVY